MNPEIEKLVEMALADRQVTDKEREIILRKAEKLCLDVDEVEMYLENRINLDKHKNNHFIGNETKIDLDSEKLSDNKIIIKKKYIPKKVNKIEAASLQKENHLKEEINIFNIEILNYNNDNEKLNNEKDELTIKSNILNEYFSSNLKYNNFTKELENFDDEILSFIEENELLLVEKNKLSEKLKIPHNVLVSKFHDIDEQLKILNNENKSRSKICVDNFIYEINKSVSLKYGKLELRIIGLDNIIGLNKKEILNYIKKKGTWSISNLVLKRKIRLYLIILTLILNIIIFSTIHQLVYLIILNVIFGIVIIIYSNFLKLNISFLSTTEYDVLLTQIIENHLHDFEELHKFKKHIKKLDSLQKSINSISSYF